MKKFAILFLTAFTVLGASLFAEAPAFDDPNGVVILARQIPGKGSLEEEFNIKNATSGSNFSVTVFAYDERNKNWTLFGTIKKLKGLNDDSDIKISAKKFMHANYFAITTSLDKPLEAFAYYDDEDLKVVLCDAVDLSEENSVVIDSQTIGGFTSNVKLVGGPSLKTPVVFNVYGMMTPNSEPKFLFISVLKGAKDTDTHGDAYNGDEAKNYRYIKLSPRSSEKFTYFPRGMRNDLIVNVGQD